MDCFTNIYKKKSNCGWKNQVFTLISSYLCVLSHMFKLKTNKNDLEIYKNILTLFIPFVSFTDRRKFPLIAFKIYLLKFTLSHLVVK